MSKSVADYFNEHPVKGPESEALARACIALDDACGLDPGDEQKDSRLLALDRAATIKYMLGAVLGHLAHRDNNDDTVMAGGLLARTLTIMEEMDLAQDTKTLTLMCLPKECWQEWADAAATLGIIAAEDAPMQGRLTDSMAFITTVKLVHAHHEAWGDDAAKTLGEYKPTEDEMNDAVTATIAELVANTRHPAGPRVKVYPKFSTPEKPQA